MTTASVQTVLGPIPADELGITLCHEHLLVDLVAPYYEPPADRAMQTSSLAPFTREMRDRAVANFNAIADNLRLDSRDLAVRELQPLLDAGGTGIVELTSADIGRDPLGLREIAARTGLHVVMGCGYYIDRSQPASVRRATVDDIATAVIRDLQEGAEGTDVRAGIIGEIGVDALSDQERKVLHAAACAQRQTGAAINVHVEFIMGGAAAGYWARDILLEAGADLSRVIFSHQDSSHADRAYQESLLQDGIVLEYDGFGYEMRTTAYGGLTYPTDAERIAALAVLVNEGWEQQLLVSTDICMKFLLRTFGGHGYAHIFLSVLPRMREAGMSNAAIHAMVVDNPRRLLAIGVPERAQAQP